MVRRGRADPGDKIQLKAVRPTRPQMIGRLPRTRTLLVPSNRGIGSQIRGYLGSNRG